jgi:hypothetical protein
VRLRLRPLPFRRRPLLLALPAVRRANRHWQATIFRLGVSSVSVLSQSSLFQCSGTCDGMPADQPAGGGNLLCKMSSAILPKATATRREERALAWKKLAGTLRPAERRPAQTRRARPASRAQGDGSEPHPEQEFGTCDTPVRCVLAHHPGTRPTCGSHSPPSSRHLRGESTAEPPRNATPRSTIAPNGRTAVRIAGRGA